MSSPISLPNPSSSPAEFYWELEAELPAESEELWSLFLFERGASGAEQVSRKPGRLTMCYYFAALEAGAARKWGAEFAATYPDRPAPDRLSQRRRFVQDWQRAWRGFFTPRLVGERFTICPPWAVEALPEAEGEIPAGPRLNLVIDPGQGFGTGGHASTTLALELLEGRLAAGAPPAAMLDVGIGSGILAIAAGLLGVRRLLGLEIDWRALPGVRRNFRLNGLAPPSLVRGKPDCLRGRFPLVAANLTGPILQAYAAELKGLTAPGGALVISGILADESQGTRAAFERLGFAAAETAQEEGWQAYLMTLAED